jgi:hypothetical protein
MLAARADPGRSALESLDNKEHHMKQSLWIPAVISAAILSACGGGSDAPSTGADTAGGVPTGPTALTVTGTAATGAAIGGKTVNVKCSTGTGSASSGTDGKFTVSVTSGALPCVLEITPESGPALHSVATGTGNAATANINPVTQLVIASLAGADPAAYFTGFDSTAAASVTGDKVAAAVTAVKGTLLTAGLDLGAIDVLTGTLTPATSGTAGNAYDQVLDALAAKLTSTGTTLDTLATTVAANSPAVTPGVAALSGNNASLPADLLLKTPASSCAALRSGTYRVMMPTPNATLADQFGTLTVDASNLHIVYSDGSAGQWTAHATEACRFTDETGKSDIVVSQAGVIVGRSNEGSTFRPIVAFPEQTHTLAELAGTWNVIGVNPDDADTAYTGVTATGTLDATGNLSAISVCLNESTWDVSTCVAQTGPQSTRAIDSAGGYDVVEPGGHVSGRGFVYRAGGGELMRVEVYDRGDFSVWAKQRTSDLPTSGRVNTTWDIRYSNQLLATPAVSESTNTVTTVDATAGSFVRLAKTVGGTDEHLETVVLNDPRAGFNFRAAATVTGTDGTTSVPVSEWTNLGLRGMGLNALTRPAQKQFMFSVQQP